MAKDAKVLRTVYIDADIDDLLHETEAQVGLSKAELFRRYLAAGIKAAKAKPTVINESVLRSDRPLVLRSVYMDPKLDDRLRVQAFDQQTSRNDLMRRYVRLGIGEQI